MDDSSKLFLLKLSACCPESYLFVFLFRIQLSNMTLQSQNIKQKNPILWFVLLACLLINCKKDAKDELQYYGNGAISKKTHLINNKKQGEMIDYYVDGKVKSVRLFKDDFQTGKSTFYYQNGSIEEVQYFEKDKQNGGDTSFYENGIVKMIVEYKDGLKNGFVRKFDTTGTQYFFAKYEMEKLVEVNGIALQK